MADRRQRLRDFARENRKNPTRAEAVLWSRLRGKGLGVRFRREEPIGPFIVDFACRDRRIIIEVDGPSHQDSSGDEEREAWLRTRGWRVLRFFDEDVLEERDATLDVVHDAVQGTAGC